MQPTLPDSLLCRLSALLATRIGLHFPAERWSDLERGISAAAPAFGLPDARSCAHWLLSAPLARREIEILASCLTIGETYFFREQPSFDALEHSILPALLRTREGSGRRLRIWSAGCCTGEEPYSIAMLLDRLIPDPAAWNVTVHATDINPMFLRKAAAAEYGPWSFRSTPAWIKDRYFHPARADHFKLDERIRTRVVFDHLNLADDAYPSRTNKTNAMDIIFCRNVLMYFSAQRARAVIDNFHCALVDGGWLIVSPAETSGTLFSNFTPVEFDGATLYRKDCSARAPNPGITAPIPAPDAIQAFLRVDEGGTSGSSMAADVHGIAAPRPSERDQLSRAARDCANQGRLGEAAGWCRKLIAVDKLNPAHYYLLSAIEQEQGQPDAAAQSLARALYIDPDFALAHYALGNLSQSQGRQREAKRHFANTLALLHGHPADEILPESDGLTAGRLGEIIESMQSSMRDIAALP